MKLIYIKPKQEYIQPMDVQCGRKIGRDKEVIATIKKQTTTH